MFVPFPKKGRIQNRIEVFFTTFHLGSLLNRSGIHKVRGTSPLTIFTTIFSLPFYGVTFFRGIVHNNELDFLKDAAYDFLKGWKFNWCNLLLQLSCVVSGSITTLTNEDREKVLIIDESTYDRLRSKKVLLLARVYDCCTKRYLKGFRLLTLGWSDGASFVPLDFALLSSANEGSRYQGITKAIDKKSWGIRIVMKHNFE